MYYYAFAYPSSFFRWSVVGKVKFCKPPRQFYNGPDESTALGQEYAALNAVTSDEEDDQNEASDPKRIKKRYPSRKDGHR